MGTRAFWEQVNVGCNNNRPKVSKVPCHLSSDPHERFNGLVGVLWLWIGELVGCVKIQSSRNRGQKDPEKLYWERKQEVLTACGIPSHVDQQQIHCQTCKQARVVGLFYWGYTFRQVNNRAQRDFTTHFG